MASSSDLYQSLIQEAAAKERVDPAILMKMLRQESAGDPKAKSKKGALGLMQLMSGTAKELGVTDPTDPRQAIYGGARYLRKMLDMFDNDYRLALAAYNAGPGAVQKYGGIPPYPETQDYVTKIHGGGGVSPMAGQMSPVMGGQKKGYSYENGQIVAPDSSYLSDMMATMSPEQIDAFSKQYQQGMYDLVPDATAYKSETENTINRINQLVGEYNQPEKLGFIEGKALPAAAGLAFLLDFFSKDEDRSASASGKAMEFAEGIQSKRDKKKLEKRQKLLDALGIESQTSGLRAGGYNAMASAKGAQNQTLMNAKNAAVSAQSTKANMLSRYLGDTLAGAQAQQQGDLSQQGLDMQKELYGLTGDNAAPTPDEIDASVRKAYREIRKEIREDNKPRIEAAQSAAELQKIYDEIDALAEMRLIKESDMDPKLVRQTLSRMYAEREGERLDAAFYGGPSTNNPSRPSRSGLIRREQAEPMYGPQPDWAEVLTGLQDRARQNKAAAFSGPFVKAGSLGKF